MQINLKICLLFFVSTVLFSCDNDKPTIPAKSKAETNYEKQQLLDSLNERNGYNLVKKYNAITELDSQLRYTFQIEDDINKNNRPLLIKGYIQDITKKDSSYFLTIRGSIKGRKSFVKIERTGLLLSKLLTNPNRNPVHGWFIFKPFFITVSSLLTIDAKNTKESSETLDDVSSYLSYDYIKMFSSNGKLIDYYLVGVPFFRSVQN